MPDKGLKLKWKQPKKNSEPCKWCKSQDHESGACPSLSFCDRCGERGHFPKVCPHHTETDEQRSARRKEEKKNWEHQLRKNAKDDRTVEDWSRGRSLSPSDDDVCPYPKIDRPFTEDERERAKKRREWFAKQEARRKAKEAEKATRAANAKAPDVTPEQQEDDDEDGQSGSGDDDRMTDSASSRPASPPARALPPRLAAPQRSPSPPRSRQEHPGYALPPRPQRQQNTLSDDEDVHRKLRQAAVDREVRSTKTDGQRRMEESRDRHVRRSHDMEVGPERDVQRQAKDRQRDHRHNHRPESNGHTSGRHRDDYLPHGEVNGRPAERQSTRDRPRDDRKLHSTHHESHNRNQHSEEHRRHGEEHRQHGGRHTSRRSTSPPVKKMKREDGEDHSYVKKERYPRDRSRSGEPPARKPKREERSPERVTALEPPMQKVVVEEVSRPEGMAAVAPDADGLTAHQRLLLSNKAYQKKVKLQSDHFLCPSWATMPEAGVRLEVRKGGQKLPTIQVDRNLYYLFGRGKGIVDFFVEHPSASRIHFALIHDGANKMTYVYDLGSKAKTRIDGKAIPPRKAVLLPDGAMLTIGESSRCYILRRKSMWEEDD